MPSGGHNKISRSELVRDLTGFARSRGKAPTQKEYNQSGKYSATAVQNEFGTWNGAKDELGLEVYHRHNTAKLVECEYCGTEVERRPSKIEAHEHQYCSQECHDQHRRETYTHENAANSTMKPVECAACGATIQRAKWRRESRENHFCDHECMGAWRAENVTGEDHPRWRDFPTNECEYCGRSYTIKPSEEERSRFCSKNCLYQQLAVSWAGEGSPRYSKVTKECQNCGDEYKIKPALADESSYCSKECLWEGWNPTGKDHPRWNPDSEQLYYGPNWMKQRQRTIVRDRGRCQIPGCGTTEPQNIAHCGVGLDVHHITALREFEEREGIDYEKANDLSNLVALCRECHRHVESDSHGLSV